MNLVVGATGVLGSEICRILREAGKPVRALVRSSSAIDKKQGLEQMGAVLIEGDLKNRSSLEQACDGVNAVISTATSIVSRQGGDSLFDTDRDGNIQLIESAEAKGVRRFVFISFPPFPFSIPLQDAKREVEKKLQHSRLIYTILQPTFFQEVWLSPHLGFDPERGSIRIYGDGKNKISWISYKDVARLAVAVLDDPSAENSTLPLGGPDSVSPEQVVSIFEQAAGKKMNVEFIPESVLLTQYEAASDPVQKSFAGMMLGYSKTGPIDMTGVLERFPMSLQSVEDYARALFPTASA